MPFSDHFKAKISADTAGVEEGINKADKKVKGFSKSVSGMFQKFLAVGAVTSFLGNLKELTTTLQDTSDRLGVSTDFLQKFRYASEQSGVKISEAEMGLQRFLRRAGTAQSEGGELAELLEEMGVSLTKTNGTLKSGEELFVEFADAVGKVEEPGQKLAKSFRLLDSEGIKLLQLIGDGGDKFRDLSNEAENLGLVLDQKTIKSVKTTDEELKKAKSQFQVLAVQVLPPLLKALNLSVQGWKGIVGAIKLVVVEAKLFAKTFSEEVADTFMKFSSHIDYLKAEIEAFTIKINPFSTEEDVERAEKRVERYAKTAQKWDEESKKTFAQNRQEILKMDRGLQKERQEAIQSIQNAQKKSKEIIDGNIEAEEKHNSVLGDTSGMLNKINEQRSSINEKITDALERIKALKDGGLEELATTIRRQKAEQDIIKLIESGKLSREQAEETINKLIKLEKQEKDLVSELKTEKENILAIEKEREKKEELLNNLIKEKEIALEISQINSAITTARQQGLDKEVEILEQKKLVLETAGLNLAEADKETTALQNQIDKIAEKRLAMDANLEVLNLMAQGRDEEAKILQSQIELDKEIIALANDLNISLREAKDIVGEKAELENQIALKQLQEKARQVELNEIRELAQKRVRDAVDEEERKRIQVAQKIERFEDRIAQLRERGDNRAKAEIEKLEQLKEREMEIILSDETKDDLAKLKEQEDALQDQFEIHKKAMEKQLAEIVRREQVASDHALAEANKLDELRRQQLEHESKLITQAKDEFIDVGDAVDSSLEETGEKVVDSIDGVGDKLKENNDVLLNAIQSLATEVGRIPTAISGITFPDFPQFPEIPPSIVKVDIDTEKLSQEETNKLVLEQLKGKFVNQ